MSRHFMVFAVLSALALACSSATDPAGSGGSTNGTTPGGSSGTGTGDPGGPGGTSSSKYSCCLNDVHYKCPDQAAFDKCSGAPAGGQDCEAKCAPGDVQCLMACADARSKTTHDPSACTKTTEACPSSNSCNGVGTGKCAIDADCGSGNHCTDGKCFSNSAGSKCDIDADCGSGNHCTDGCCLDNAAGSKCDIDADCGSGNHCTDGKCYANRFGSPCDIDADCGSGNECTNGRCR